MGETPQAAATKLFGGRSETCEEKIQSHLRSLRKVLAEFLDWRASEEKQRLDYLEPSGAERRRIGAEFERLRRVLAEQERAVLGRLAELDAAFEAAQVEQSSRVAEGIVRLHGLIGQLEAQLERNAAPPPLGAPRLSSCHRQRDALREALEQFRGMGRPETKLGAGNSPRAEEKVKASPQPVAAPRPQLLADRKSVRWCEEGRDGAREPRRGQQPAGGCGGAAPGRCGTRTR